MLDKIFDSSGQILPTTGFWGFVLQRWMVIAIVVMVIGFLIDQVLYFIRYRPQDKWREDYYAFRRFLTRHFNAPAAHEPKPSVQEKADFPAAGDGVTMRRPVAREPVFDAVPRERATFSAQQRHKDVVRSDAVDEPVIRRTAQKPVRPAPRTVEAEDTVTRMEAPRATMRAQVLPYAPNAAAPRSAASHAARPSPRQVTLPSDEDAPMVVRSTRPASRAAEGEQNPTYPEQR